MKLSTTKLVAACVLAGILLGLVPQGSDLSSVPPITPDQFAKLKALIRPAPGEDQWAEIPWLASLWQARERAAAEGKPILLWEMDGHPLGCG
jgi:hypothetical protein